MSSFPANRLLVVISSASGAGKTTLIHHLLAARPDMARAITCTTRPPRAGERTGADYHFLSPGEFDRRIARGDFIEHATVYDHRYGVLRDELLGRLRADRDVLLNVDVQGCATLRRRALADPDLSRALVMIFLTPPSRAVLEQRLRSRGTDAPGVIARRLEAVQEEVRQWVHFDYLLVSGAVEDDLRRALAIIEAEKLRQPRSQLPADFAQPPAMP